jgi:hypothetical protein
MTPPAPECLPPPECFLGGIGGGNTRVDRNTRVDPASHWVRARGTEPVVPTATDPRSGRRFVGSGARAQRGRR